MLSTLALLAAAAVAPHSISLAWTASADGGTVNVYRASGSCSATFSQLATGVAAGGPYADSTVTAGQWSYQVTAVVGGAESAPSNCVTLTVLPQSPQALQATQTK